MTISRSEAWQCSSVVRRLVLGIDPGDAAGASLVLAEGDELRLLFCREVETLSRGVERTLAEAAEHAYEHDIALSFAIESWGSGGERSLESWIGLGAAMGAWTRAIALMKGELPPLRGDVRRALMASWRAALLPGTHAEARAAGGGKRSQAVWKRAATAKVAELFPGAPIPGSNAAEAALIALYDTRDIAAGEAVAKTLREAERAERKKHGKAKRAAAKGGTPPAPRTLRKITLLGE